MKKLRGFRLSKRLVRVWRWVRRRRRLKHGAYVTLSHTAATPSTTSSSRSPLFFGQQYHLHTTATARAVTAKIAGWGRSLTRRLASTSAACSRRGGREGGGDDGGDLLPSQHGKGKSGLLHRRHRKQQNQAKEEEEEDWSWKPPPKGHLAVYVGRRGVEPPRRVLVPVVYFNHPLFGELLREAEEEFGFHHPGGISIPCPVADFESVRRRVAAAGVGTRRSAGAAAGWRC